MEFTTLWVQIIGAFRCGCCLLVIGVQNPIHSILILIRVFFLGSLLLFILQREYFARLFLIVYVGAIVVLFLFIIRRLELKRVNVARRLHDLFSYRHIMLGFLILEVLLIASHDFFDLTFFFTLLSQRNAVDEAASVQLIEAHGFFDWSAVLHRTDHLRAIGGVLYTEYKISLVLAAILLFISRVGALAVTLFLATDASSKGVFAVEAIPTIKRQDSNYQARRHPAFAYNAYRKEILI